MIYEESIRAKRNRPPLTDKRHTIKALSLLGVDLNEKGKKLAGIVNSNDVELEAIATEDTETLRSPILNELEATAE